jgi:tRNA(fMet)-specific endonuclease VapC
VYLLDTNICSALMKGNRRASIRFNRAFPQCYTSTIVVAELYKGILDSQRLQDNLQSLADLTTYLAIESFDLAAAEEFGRIQVELKRIGKPTGEVDALIAAVARSRQSILVTNNTRHFENIANLQLEDWLEP